MYVHSTDHVRTNLQIVRFFVYTRPTDMADDPQLPPKLSRVELRTARLVKRNEQVGADSKLEEMQDLVFDALWDNELFVAVAEPKIIRPPMFSRYTPDMRYGAHMDNSLIGEIRIDLSLTLFLSDPA